ncbi:MAG TPA: response regulator [Flavobacterium sp.]|nr:response regulator [Flavobacterium sp.]
MTISSVALKIMLADDDEDDRELFAEAIDSDNTEVLTFSNGKKLMEVLKSGRELPSCVFLDLNMPVKGGKECLAEIRSNPELKGLPVIIYSTSSNKKDIDETFTMGANLYVVKPGSFKKLRETLSKILRYEWPKHRPVNIDDNYVFTD